MKPTGQWALLATVTSNNYPIGVVVGLGNSPLTAIASVKGLTSWQQEIEKDCKEVLIICYIPSGVEYSLGEFVPIADFKQDLGINP